MQIKTTMWYHLTPLKMTIIKKCPFWRRSAWDFFGRNDAEAETPILWPPHAKSWLIGKDSDAGRDWGQDKKGTTEDEMAGWHHWLNGYEFGWTPGVGDGHGGLACCNSWGCNESDTNEWLNWLNEKMYKKQLWVRMWRKLNPQTLLVRI